MSRSTIEWLQRPGCVPETWNPVTGCSKCSAGCKNCYAAAMAKRFWGDRKFTDVQCHQDRLSQPLRWRKPRMCFVNSMSDLFHEDVPDGFIDQVFAVMAINALHSVRLASTLVLLTKRAERMRDYMIGLTAERLAKAGAPMMENWDNWWDSLCRAQQRMPAGKWFGNVWLGISISNQKDADKSLPFLLQTPAAMRVVSYEPALEAVDFSGDWWCQKCAAYLSDSRVTYNQTCDACDHPTEVASLLGDGPDGEPGVDWLIMGSESGPGARPMELDWARAARDQCVEASVPFFLKQAEIDGKLVKMPKLDGHVWDQYPEVG
jgi:protein gp37